jgi:CheY-like chemotaxis protein
VVDLRELVRGMERLLRRLIGEDIELAMVLPDEVGRVWADAGQLEQVLLNLALNARDAMPGGGRLTIELRDLELASGDGSDRLGLSPGPWVVLSVTDTGQGMDRETQQRIFEPFFTTKEPGRGTGLGLATVFGIVQQSRGEVRVQSEPGKGSRFEVYLPRTGLAPSAKAELPSPSTVRGNETILLVEDEQSVRRLISTVLRKHGYQVLEAENGGHALLICEQHTGKIDLLLTDVVMPLLSGGQLAERLASIKPDMKVLFVSGYAERTMALHGVRAGGAFLQKPITPDVLLRKVRAVLDEVPASAPMMQLH